MRYKKRNILFNLIAGLLFGLAVGHAQQQPMFTKYTFDNHMLFNPASTGRQGLKKADLAFRSQWANVEGGPQTIAAAYQSPISSGNAGYGMNIIKESVGFDRQWFAQVNYAYHLTLKDEWQLSSGIKAGYKRIESNFDRLITPQPGLPDPVYENNQTYDALTGGFGLLIHNTRYYAGLGVPVLVSGRLEKNQFAYPLLEPHWYFSTGYVFSVPAADIDIKPFVFLRYQRAAPLQSDVNVQFWFKDRFSAGLAYRTGDAVSAMLEIMVLPELSLSYAYDHTYSEFTKIGGTAHEIILQYRWLKQDQKVQSIHKIFNIPRF